MAKRIKNFTISIDISDDNDSLTNANVDVELAQPVTAKTLDSLSCILADLIAEKVKAELKTEDVSVCH